MYTFNLCTMFLNFAWGIFYLNYKSRCSLDKCPEKCFYFWVKFYLKTMHMYKKEEKHTLKTFAEIKCISN